MVANHPTRVTIIRQSVTQRLCPKITINPKGKNCIDQTISELGFLRSSLLKSIQIRA